ncbi:MAG: M15 family metallopeptidase [Janibacter sp.]
MSSRALVRTSAAAVAALTLPFAGAPVAGAAPGGPPDRPSAPEDIVDLADVAPTIEHDIRYRTRHNFTGTRVAGYQQARCLLTRDAATRLAKVQHDVRTEGYSLKVYDCYRPQRAVDHFVRWAADEDETTMEREFYPRVDKSTLFEDGYIAEHSGHSRASTVDLTLTKVDAPQQKKWTPADGLQPCYWPSTDRFPDNSIDMGTGYDCFDTRSHTDDPRSTERQKANRQRLVDAMDRRGFANYENEWWHFTLDDEPYPDTYFDFIVSKASLVR